MFEGPAEELQLTENTQPAILTVSIAAAHALEANGFRPQTTLPATASASTQALVTAGAMHLVDAVRTVRSRGRYMQEAVPVGVGAMAAVLGAQLNDIEKVCAKAGEGEICSPANINAPNQVVIAGHAAAIDRAVEGMKEIGAKRVVKLNVSAPFHCALMKPAQDRLAIDLQQLAFNDLQVPVVTNVDARITKDAGEVRDALISKSLRRYVGSNQ